MAVVGKGFAVLQTGKIHLSGFPAWLAWAVVHLEFLAQASLRVSVLVQWIWTGLTEQRGSQLIVNHCGTERGKAAADAPHEALAPQGSAMFQTALPKPLRLEASGQADIDRRGYHFKCSQGLAETLEVVRQYLMSHIKYMI
jgi:hypothetical protein